MAVCQVVTIARSLAADGEDVGRQVAAALGFRYVDNEIVDAQQAERAGRPKGDRAVGLRAPGLLPALL